MKFTYSVDSLPEMHLAGIFVKSNHASAQKDCTALWHTFGPRICSLMQQCGGTAGFSYGVSIMDEEPNTFTYWAAVEVDPAKPLPEGMHSLVVPGGEYVHCTAASLAVISDAFTEMYMEWPKGQQEYEVVMTSPCFERYDGDWQMSDPIEIYAPVVKKG